MGKSTRGIHGGPFVVVAIDGETLAPSARYAADTVKMHIEVVE